jgi:hypothetical protein
MIFFMLDRSHSAPRSDNGLPSGEIGRRHALLHALRPLLPSTFYLLPSTFYLPVMKSPGYATDASARNTIHSGVTSGSHDVRFPLPS